MPMREPHGQGLDVERQTDRYEGHLRVLREVVADHGEAAGVPDVDVDDT